MPKRRRFGRKGPDRDASSGPEARSGPRAPCAPSRLVQKRPPSRGVRALRRRVHGWRAAPTAAMRRFGRVFGRPSWLLREQTPARSPQLPQRPAVSPAHLRPQRHKLLPPRTEAKTVYQNEGVFESSRRPAPRRGSRASGNPRNCQPSVIRGPGAHVPQGTPCLWAPSGQRNYLKHFVAIPALHCARD